MLRYIFKHFKLLKRYAILSAKRSVEYRVSFYFGMLTIVTNVLIWLAFWRIILSYVPTYAGWDFPMLVILLGFFFFQDSLWIVFWRNWDFAEDILNGYIAIFLVKPMNTYFAMVWKYLDIMRAFEMAVGIGLIIAGMIMYGFELSVLKFAIALTVCTIGSFLSMNLFALINTLSFWLGRTSFLRNTLSTLFILEKTPVNILQSTLRFTYTFAIPLIFLATYPALIITRLSLRESLAVLGVEITVAIVWFSFFAFVWKKGVERFEAYGG